MFGTCFYFIYQQKYYVQHITTHTIIKYIDVQFEFHFIVASILMSLNNYHLINILEKNTSTSYNSKELNSTQILTSVENLKLSKSRFLIVSFTNLSNSCLKSD